MSQLILSNRRNVINKKKSDDKTWSKKRALPTPQVEKKKTDAKDEKGGKKLG